MELRERNTPKARAKTPRLGETTTSISSDPLLRDSRDLANVSPRGHLGLPIAAFQGFLDGAVGLASLEERAPCSWPSTSTTRQSLDCTPEVKQPIFAVEDLTVAWALFRHSVIFRIPSFQSSSVAACAASFRTAWLPCRCL